MKLTKEVLAGLDFLFDLADTNDNLCYADRETKDNFKAAGEWFAEVKKEFEAKK